MPVSSLLFVLVLSLSFLHRLIHYIRCALLVIISFNLRFIPLSLSSSHPSLEVSDYETGKNFVAGDLMWIVLRVRCFIRWFNDFMVQCGGLWVEFKSLLF